MNPIDEKNLDAAISLGSAVCKKLGICCDLRGRVIFQIYQKLEDLKSEKSSTPDAISTATVNGDVTTAIIGTGAATAAGPCATACAAPDNADSGQPSWKIKN